MISHFWTGGTATNPVTPSGWTELGVATDGGNHGWNICSRTVDGTEGSNVHFNTAAGYSSLIGILAYAAGNGFDAPMVGAVDYQNTMTIQSITTLLDKDMVVAVIDASQGLPPTGPVPSGWTERMKQLGVVQTFTGAGGYDWLYAMDKPMPTAGPSGTVSLPLGAGSFYFTWTLSIKVGGSSAAWVHISSR